MEENKKKSPLGVSSFVLGLISLFSTLFYYISLPTGVLAIVFGVKAIKKTGSNLGKAGLILGIIGLCIMTFIYVTLILGILVSR
jgi:hypothetical protein